MRRLPLPLAALACLVAGTAHCQPRPAERDLLLVNRGSRVINEVYASPSSETEWGTDRLGNDTIPPGQSVRLHLGRTSECEFDIQAIYGDAAREERHRVDVCHTRTLSLDGSTALPSPVSTPVSTPGHVRLVNRAGRPIQQAFLSPAEAGDWGDDRLAASLSTGDTAELSYAGPCLVDIRIVYDNRAAEERRGVDVCALGGLLIAPGWTTADRPPAPPPIAR